MHRKFTVNDGMELLRSAVVYGPNAGGKSNLIRAFVFMRWVILRSFSWPQDEPFPDERYRLDENTRAAPTQCETVFIADGTQYRYGFSVNDSHIEKEWLYYVPRSQEKVLFTRTGQSIDIAKGFEEGRDLKDKTRPNALFLSVVSQFNGTIATTITNWFQRAVVSRGFGDVPASIDTAALAQRGGFRRKLLRLLQGADLGIEDVAVKNVPVSVPPVLAEMLEHSGNKIPDEILELSLARGVFKNGERVNSVAFDFDDESDGTRHLAALAGPMLTVLDNGGIAFVDELDARLHPLLSEALIGLFHSPDNKNNAQLVFTTHNVNLLSQKLFRRDQTWFVEKDSQGNSDLRSLAEYKGVRNDQDYGREYLSGRYGALPLVDMNKRHCQDESDGEA